ncbi:flavin monoamine oxidase family protein [Sphingomonas nostoxanthinifaciens]|uniref:flavin monoamine oxidase family protein n=1 Tax=Sphingomonas nostoxanthinifaciens TaxID=2872652 RepID=UPI001CC1FA43|nr:NAD(P)/FAD-dependent oxidoreductase [Sphingomonas nostoxanthinifaciens]UAK22828.1 FAD-dependent oxidoreductase [Sphingomonas nostoxanthinifaciens]
MTQVDVVVVGGGAAGIAAARRLHDRGRSVLIVEALDRLGGRAHTRQIAGLPLDLGCGWLHSAGRNPLARLAEAEGIRVDHSQAAWQRQLGNIGFSASDQNDAWAAYADFEERLRSHPPAGDRAADAVAPDDRWRPFLDALSSFINGCELDSLSAADFMAYEDASTELNWRLPAGYGTFIAGLGGRLLFRLGTPVRAVANTGDGIHITTDAGDIAARAAIVAVSTEVLARGQIRFSPDVTDHLHAATRLPLGLADKVFLSIAQPDAVPAESHLLGRVDRTQTGSYYIRPFGRPVIECFLGGAWARELEGGDAVAFVVDELKGLLGGDFAAGLSPIAVTRWAQEPTIGGSYSHALPDHADARNVLAHPVSERLCFAGEACSSTDFSTAHGAWESGLAAADWIERGLG